MILTQYTNSTQIARLDDIRGMDANYYVKQFAKFYEGNNCQILYCEPYTRSGIALIALYPDQNTLAIIKITQ